MSELELWWNKTDRGEKKYLRKIISQRHFSIQIPQRLVLGCTRAFAVTGRRKTASALARTDCGNKQYLPVPYITVFILCTSHLKIKQMHFEEAGFLGSGTVWLVSVSWRFEGKTSFWPSETLTLGNRITSQKNRIHKSTAVGISNHTKICILLIRVEHSYWIWYESTFSSEC